MSPQEQADLARRLARELIASRSRRGVGPPSYGYPRGRPITKRRPLGGLESLYEPPDNPPGEGNLLGSAWEAVKSLPRGARQFGLMARQGIAGLATPDEDTPYEKELRRKLQALYEEIDPKYREAHLPQLGMVLGQIESPSPMAVLL